MKAKIKTFILFFIPFILLFACVISVFGEENKDKIRVGFYEFPYFQNIGEDGGFSGYSYDYLQAIAQYTGWEYEYVTGVTFSECQEMLKNGEIDILGVMQKTPEREEVYDFPDLPSGISMSFLVTDKENQNLAYEDFAAFDGMTVGVQKSFARNKGFQEYCEKNNITVHTITYDTKEGLLDAIHTGKVDAALISSNQNSPDYRIIAKFDPSNVYYATTQGNEKVLNELNFALEKIKITSPNFDAYLYEKYYNFSDGQPAVLSKDEVAYLKEHPTIRVLYDAEWEPFEILQADGTPHGVSIDVLEEVSKATGVNFEYTYVNNQQEKAELLHNGGFDILPAISYSYQWAEKYNVYITQPYINADYTIVSKNKFKELHHIALPRGFYISETVKTMVDRDVDITYFDTVKECIEAVNNEETDCTYVNAYEADYYISFPKYRLLQYRTVEGLCQQISVGVSKDADPILFSIITKGLSSISQEEMREIIRSHLNHPKQSGFFDMMYTNPVHFATILLILGFFLTAYAIVYILYRNKNKQNEILQTANKAKSDFLSRISHDMRTPMNAILGISSLGMGCTDLEKSKEYHEKVNQTGKYLLTLINDTLDMSVIENNKMKLHPKPYYLRELIQAAETLIHERAMENSVVFYIQMRSEFQQAVMVDKLRLQQILINLINNAIKFTPPGGRVEFIIDVNKMSQKRVNGIFIIRDTGIGMSQEFQKRMFEPFEQEEGRNAYMEGGTGLGLAIVKQLVNLMGGTILCHSQPDVGTEFIVQIEAEICDEVFEKNSNEEVCKQEEKLVGRKILLCEDHPINTQIAKTLLEKKGCIVAHGNNGQAGFDLFAKSPIGYYDAILMDIQMPLVNGLEATALIRALKRKDAASVPIIAMSANAYEEDIRRSFEAGMNAHLTKPVDSQELFKALENEIENRTE
ncbi:MAG: transporter substrate-binding domain-containing protein [Anaerotignum sp.]|nr:transporter substrate-binding domain-containing protein [Anaerotignum sp.]